MGVDVHASNLALHKQIEIDACDELLMVCPSPYTQASTCCTYGLSLHATSMQGRTAPLCFPQSDCQVV